MDQRMPQETRRTISPACGHVGPVILGNCNSCSSDDEQNVAYDVSILRKHLSTVLTVSQLSPLPEEGWRQKSLRGNPREVVHHKSGKRRVFVAHGD